MDSKTESQGSKLDLIRLIAALSLVTIAIAGFYYYADQSLLLRVLGLLLATGIAIFMAFKTNQGHQLWQFFRDAQIEVRKVIWPTRDETLKATFFVLVMVVVVAIFLWLLDLLLGAVVKTLTG